MKKACCVLIISMFGFLISGCAEEKKPSTEPGKAPVTAEATTTEASQPPSAVTDNATTVSKPAVMDTGKETGGDNMTAPAHDNTTVQTKSGGSDNQTAGRADNATAPHTSGADDNATEAKKK